MEPHIVTEALDGLIEGVQIISRDWRYLYLNEAAARQGRKAVGELVGKTMLECYPGIDATPMFAMLRRCMTERRAELMENEFTYEDGRRAWFELRVRPCPAGIVILSFDTTDRKSVELRLAASYRQALHDLVTPVIRLHDGVLFVPLVGALDAERASQMTDAILTAVSNDSAKVVLFDVSGVPTLDTAVASHLLETTAMIRLLGANVILTGVAAATARALVQLGVDLSSMKTTTRLADGLELALRMIGKTVG